MGSLKVIAISAFLAGVLVQAAGSDEPLGAGPAKENCVYNALFDDLVDVNGGRQTIDAAAALGALKQEQLGYYGSVASDLQNNQMAKVDDLYRDIQHQRAGVEILYMGANGFETGDLATPLGRENLFKRSAPLIAQEMEKVENACYVLAKDYEKSDPKLSESFLAIARPMNTYSTRIRKNLADVNHPGDRKQATAERTLIEAQARVREETRNEQSEPRRKNELFEIRHPMIRPLPDYKTTITEVVGWKDSADQKLIDLGNRFKKVMNTHSDVSHLTPAKQLPILKELQKQQQSALVSLEHALSTFEVEGASIERFSLLQNQKDLIESQHEFTSAKIRELEAGPSQTPDWLHSLVKTPEEEARDLKNWSTLVSSALQSAHEWRRRALFGNLLEVYDRWDSEYSPALSDVRAKIEAVQSYGDYLYAYAQNFGSEAFQHALKVKLDTLKARQEEFNRDTEVIVEKTRAAKNFQILGDLEEKLKTQDPEFSAQLDWPKRFAEFQKRYSLIVDKVSAKGGALSSEDRKELKEIYQAIEFYSRSISKISDRVERKTASDWVEKMRFTLNHLLGTYGSVFLVQDHHIFTPPALEGLSQELGRALANLPHNLLQTPQEKIAYWENYAFEQVDEIPLSNLKSWMDQATADLAQLKNYHLHASDQENAYPGGASPAFVYPNVPAIETAVARLEALISHARTGRGANL